MRSRLDETSWGRSSRQVFEPYRIEYPARNGIPSPVLTNAFASLLLRYDTK
jgi:hypothetical protein